jgi:hypothetical protein
LRAQAEALKGQIELRRRRRSLKLAPPQDHGSRQVERAARGGARQSGALAGRATELDRMLSPTRLKRSARPARGGADHAT